MITKDVLIALRELRASVSDRGMLPAPSVVLELRAINAAVARLVQKSEGRLDNKGNYVAEEKTSA